MWTRSVAMKFLFSIIVFSLMVPISPTVSEAKAKLCCKKTCLGMTSVSSQAASLPVKNCKHQKSSRQCCDQVCAKFITFKKVEPFFFIKVRAESDSLSEKFPLSVLDRFISLPEFNVRFKEVSSYYKLPNPPLYLSNSILLI